MPPFNSVLTATGRTNELEAKLQRRLRLNGDDEHSENFGACNLQPQNMSTTGKHEPALWMNTLALKSLATEPHKNTDAAEVPMSTCPDEMHASPQPEASSHPDQIRRSPRPAMPIPESGIYGAVNELEDKLTVRLLKVEGEDGILRQLAQREQQKTQVEPEVIQDGILRQLAQREQQKTQVEPEVIRMNGRRSRRGFGEDVQSFSSDDKTLSQLSRKLPRPDLPMNLCSPNSETPSSPLPSIPGTLSLTSTMCMDDDSLSEASDADSSDAEQGSNQELELQYDDCFDLLNHMPREKALKVARTITRSASEAQTLSDQNERLSTVIHHVSSELEADRELSDFDVPDDVHARNLLDQLAAELASVQCLAQGQRAKSEASIHDGPSSTSLAMDGKLKTLTELLANHHADLEGKGGSTAERAQLKDEIFSKVEELLAEANALQQLKASSKVEEDAVKAEVAVQNQESEGAWTNANSETEEAQPVFVEKPEVDDDITVFFRGQRRHNQAEAATVERIGGTAQTPSPERSASEAIFQAFQLGTARSIVEAGCTSANSTYDYAAYGALTTLQSMDSTVDYAGEALEVATDQLSEFATSASNPLYQAAEKVGEAFSLSWASDAWSLGSGIEVASQTAADTARALKQRMFPMSTVSLQ